MKKETENSFIDNNEWNFSLNVNPLGNTLNFEIAKDYVNQEEVCLSVLDCIRLKNIIEKFINSQKEQKIKAKSGRKKIYEGESETLSIHVPSDKKEFIKSVVEAMLKPMQIQK